MNRIFLGLGSNLGDRELHLVTARDLLMKHGVLVIGQSEVRETEPLGGLDQPKYLNQILEVSTDFEPEVLLRVCKQVEQEMGRTVSLPVSFNVQFGSPQKTEKRWESRVIDIDILFYGNTVLDTPQLTLPHPGTYDRPFLWEAMQELAADFLHPVLKKKMCDFAV